MRRCPIIVMVFAVLWALAIAVLAIGTFGWFGQEKDPLSGVFLLPLGLPWNYIADSLGMTGPTVVILAPGGNLLILLLCCRLLQRRT